MQCVLLQEHGVPIKEAMTWSPVRRRAALAIYQMSRGGRWNEHTGEVDFTT